MRCLPLLLAALFVAPQWGCSTDFRSASELDDTPQILGVFAEPPEIGEGQSTTLSALVHAPSGALSLLWLACIPDVGDTLTSCVANGLSQLTTDPPFCVGDPREKLCIAGLANGSSYTAPAGILSPDGGPRTLFLMLLATTEAGGVLTCQEALATGGDAERCLLALKRLVVSQEPFPNQNPTVSGLSFDDVASDPGAAFPLATGVDTSVLVQLTVDATSIDDFDADDSGDLVVSWFTDCGTVENRRTFLPCRSEAGVVTCDPSRNHWTPRESGDCYLHAIVRDANGGGTFRSQLVTVP